MIDPETSEDMKSFFVGVGFASASGLVSYCLRSLGRKSFSWTAFVFQIAASAIAGVVAYWAVVEFGGSPKFSAAICGVAGWMGTSALDLAKALVEMLAYKRLGVTPEEIEKLKKGIH